MTHIADLAPYDYYAGAPGGLAIGWLDSDVEFSTGSCPRDVRDRLAALASDPVRLMRGKHYCQFCMAAAPPLKLLREDIRLYEEPDVAWGNGEIWITGPDGRNFAAPAMLIHYIDEHDYLPPDAFVEAVRSGTATPGID